MKCIYCLTAYERHEQEDIADAEYIIDGRTICRPHLNDKRGHPREFDRHDEPEAGSQQALALATFIHLRDDHHVVMFKANSVEQHRDEFADCDFTVIA